MLYPRSEVLTSGRTESTRCHSHFAGMGVFMVVAQIHWASVSRTGWRDVFKP
jgi:hypothetical protein